MFVGLSRVSEPRKVREDVRSVVAVAPIEDARVGNYKYQ